MSRRERRLEARRLLTPADDTVQRRERKVGKVGHFFDRNYHKLQLIPLFILLLAIGFNVWFYHEHGDFVRKGVSLAGGTSITVTTTQPLSQTDIEAFVHATAPQADTTARILRSGTSTTGFTVEAAAINGDENTVGDTLVAALKQRYPDGTVSVETTGPSLGASFFQQTLLAVLAAFVLMAIVVFISFRTFYPSAAVVLAGFSTVVSTLAVFNILGFALSTAGVAAFLMLIGYSIDTDVLLSTRVLKQEGEFMANVWSAAKTGLTMQVTTGITVTVVLIFSNNAIFDQIMIIILIGMFFDMLYTWIQNAAILQWYYTGRQKRAAKRAGESA